MKTDKLNTLNACSDAVKWVADQKDYKTAWKNCERGDWMLWLAKKLNVDDKKLTMAKAMCAKQVEHLMQDQRSKDALQACFDYANRKITREELNAAAYAAADAAYAYAATHAAYAAADVYAAYAAADVYAAYAARITSLKKSAGICREYLTEEVLTAYKKLK